MIDAAESRDLAAASLALARRFAAGATMWCIAPAWPQHARHVAVEFVHPVIVGKRALPTVAVTGPQTVGELRSVVRAGDVLCAISTAGEPVVVDALRRAPAWGLETLWLGSGARPEAGAADHVLWTDNADPAAAYDGSLVLRYHVLWELTHVCFEHPGLMRPADDADVCITCSDEGRVGEVVEGAAFGDAAVRTAAASKPSTSPSLRRCNPETCCSCTRARRSRRSTRSRRVPEGTDFLYPFIEGDERDAGSLLTDLAASARAKSSESGETCAAALDRNEHTLAVAAQAMADRFGASGCLFTFGDGGSSTDASLLAALFADPAQGHTLRARSLVEDTAVLTALGNDVGFELVFSRQLIAHARSNDIALGCSTSGNSRNLLPRVRRSTDARDAHRGPQWVRRWRDGARRRPLPDRRFRQRAPDSREPSRARARALAPGAGGRTVTDARDRESAVLDRIESFRRRRPRLTDDVVTLAHGAGGKASAALVDAVFLEAFAPADRGPLADAASLTLPSGERLAFTTDSFVVQPRRFPGGSIGDLAVNGTVNDLAVSGAIPQWLSAGFVIEEGFPVAELRELVADMARAAESAHVEIVTGDTKVVGKGAADGLYIATTGVGVIPAGRALGPEHVQAGDVVLVSGTIADHGMAVMLARGDLALEADIRSDTAPLGALVEALLQAAPSTRWLRDPTRGGVGTVCNELARDIDLAVVLDEPALPILPQVAGACDLLGIDPLYVANEGKLLAIVAADEADAALAALRAHPTGAGAQRIGEIAPEPEGIVVLRTTFGGTRIVDMLVGDPLPRIC